MLALSVIWLQSVPLVLVWLASGGWDFSDDSDDMKAGSSKQKKKKSGRQKNVLLSIG
jgi:hypothetical protein